MSDITLSASMRANLLSLQNTSALQAQTQGRLATGKKVNSALDNPTSFFAAQSLTNAANDLSNLLDGMGQAIQSITAATQGITAAESILTQMQSVAQSASQAVGSSSGGSGGNIQAYTAQGTTGAASGTAVSATTAFKQNLTNLGSSVAGTSLNILNGDAMTVEVGTGATYTFTVGASNVNNGTVGNGGGSTLADLGTWLKTVTGSAATYTAGAIGLAATISGGVTIAGSLANDLGLAATNNSTTVVTGTVAAYTVSYSNIAAATSATTLADLSTVNGSALTEKGASSAGNAGGTAAGDYLTIQVAGGQSQSINITAGMTVQNLVSDINSIGGLSASLDSSGNLKVVNNNSSAVTIGGTAQGLLDNGAGSATLTIAANSSETTKLYAGYGAVSAGNLTTTDLKNLQAPSGLSRLASGDQLSVTVGGVTSTISVGTTDGTTTAKTVSGLLAALGQVSGITASFDSTTGQLSITAGSQSVTLGGTAAAKLGLPSSIAAGQSSASQGLATYASQFDQLRTQFNQLVQDSGYAGVNLIAGTNSSLTVQFNSAASHPNALTIAGVDLTSTGLGLTEATGNWSGAASVASSQTSLTNALGTLRSTSNALGQNLTTVQTRQDFTTNLINTLQTGAGDLTNADMNTESANMLALQTQQQLGISSLSLASQAAQSILKLFP